MIEEGKYFLDNHGSLLLVWVVNLDLFIEVTRLGQGV